MKYFSKQRQENFFGVRVKSSGGEFSAAQLGAVQTLAETFGAGKIRLTSRQEISVPFIEEKNFTAVEEFCAAHGLELCPLGATLKTIVACQGSEICRSGLIDAPKIAREIERRHGRKILPAKFLIGVSGCPNNCMKVDMNDIGIVGAVKPIRGEMCNFCGACAKICPVGALTVDRKKNLWAIDETCRHCGRCVKICPKDLRGEVGYKIYFRDGKIFPFVQGEETLYKIIDAAINFFAEHAHKGEHPKNFTACIEDFTKKISLE